MSWTYDPSLDTDLDRVRLEIGDTIETDQQFQNEELEYLLDRDGSVVAAAAAAARLLAAKYARQVDMEVGDLKKMYSQRVTQYNELADRLAARSTLNTGIPYAGGLSLAEKDADLSNGDLVSSSIRRGIHDNV